MILSKEEKNWFDSYSKAGKEATKFNKIFTDAIRNTSIKAQKKKRVNPCPEIAAFESIEKKQEEMEEKLKLLNEDNIDIFNEPKVEEKLKINKYINQKKNLKNNYKFHDYHMSHLKKKETEFNPCCTKYNPKYDSIKKVPQSIPSWEKQSGRKTPKKKDSCDEFYIEHKDIIDTMAGSSFIDMSKQPEKKGLFSNLEEKEYIIDNYSFIKSNNFEYNFNYNFNEDSKRPISGLTKEVTKASSRVTNKSNINDITDSNTNRNKKTTSRISSASNIKRKIIKNVLEKKKRGNIMNISEIKQNDIININDNNEKNINYKIINNKRRSQTLNSNNTAFSSNNSMELVNQYYLDRMKKINANKKKKSSSYIKKKSKIKAPDFSKNLSRESLEKLKEGNNYCVPYIIPNYTQIREKPIMLVSYTKKDTNHKIYRNLSSKIPKMNYSFYYDADKAIKNINNHSVIHPPDFNLMSSRPLDDDDPLPLYMKKLVDRSGLSQFSLNMNNYKNRGLGSIKTSFFPKKSYNKLVNINLLKSRKFFGNILFGENKRKLIKNDPLMAKVIRFYNQNLQNIMAERSLKKFDGVTLKAYDNNLEKL